MSPLPERGTPAGDAFLAIQKLARSTGSDVQELLTLYALEGVLARVAQSHWSEEFVLKGGVLLAAFDLRRPTKDIDLQATGLPNDIEAVLDSELREALEVVADYRAVDLRPLLSALNDMPGMAQSKWEAWRRRQAQGDQLPAMFAETLAGVAVFVDPVLGSSGLDLAWNPRRRSWS